LDEGWAIKQKARQNKKMYLTLAKIATLAATPTESSEIRANPLYSRKYSYWALHGLI
jgi:hypothetical protein